VIIGGRAHNIKETEYIGEKGFPFAEINIADPKAFFDKELYLLRKIQDTYKLTYLAHGPEEGNAWEPEVLIRELLPQMKSLFDCLKELSIPLITIHFWIDSRFLDSNVIDEKIDILKELVYHASERGIQLCIENLSERFSDFLRAFDAIGTLGMTLDIGHGELITKKNTAYDFIQYCFERIYHIHVHDNKGGDSPTDDLHLPLGDGTIDFASILFDLKKRGFDKTITLEVKSEHLINGRKIIEDIWNNKTLIDKGLTL
jgi:sugar phosphate isomerase/epimerase